MPVVEFSGCHKKLHVPDEEAGRNARCPECGAIFTVPMIVLCAFEFGFFSSAARMHPRELASKAQTLAVFEIIVGLLNMVSLVCGIIVLVNAGNIARARS